MFLETIKYFQQSLLSLANSLTDNENKSIQMECLKCISKDESLLRKFTENDQKWITNYLSSGKGAIPYEMITTFDSLNISPQKGEFFQPELFYSDLKDDIISREEYENVKKFWEIMNFDNKIFLCKIFEQRSDQFQKLFGYSPRKCNFASSFSECTQRR